MSIRRPQLPKVLAARIKAAQRKVADKRLAIIAGERRIAQANERVMLYEASPYAYAQQYYQGRDVESHSVQTRITRDREELAYYQRRAPERIFELAEAEARLAAIEDEILLKVLASRPSAGRVPWPRRLKSFESVSSDLQLEWARKDEKLKVAHARQMAIMNAHVEEVDDAFLLSITVLHDAVKAYIDRMPTDKQVQARDVIADRLNLLRSGEIGAFEFLAGFAV